MQVEDLEKQLKALQAQFDEKSKELSLTKHDLSRSNILKQAMEEDQRNLENAKEEVEMKFSILQKDNIELLKDREKLKAANSKLDMLRNQNMKLVDRVLLLREEIQTANSDAKLDEMKKLRCQNVNLVDEVLRLTREVELLKEKLQNRERIHKAAKKDVGQLRSQLNKTNTLTINQ